MKSMWKSCWVLPLVALLSSLRYCSAQSSGNINSTVCREATTCAECISINPNCAWCAQDNFVGERCDLAVNLNTANCTDVQNPELYAINITKNEELSNAGDAPLGKAVQVQPQEINLKIRKGETAQIEMHVRQAEDNPVDMYYLMDLSESMREDLDSLRSLADDLVRKMQELTRDFRVGFGSFVDKKVIPFANISADGSVILMDCLPGCVEPYLFKNGLRLTNSSAQFVTSLDEAESSISADQPEAGFDALVQVAACKEEIGWRESARHIVVFASDAPYHSAGDGRMGGIVKPNDGLCHLDATGMYNADQLMDYPSLGQISSLVQDENIIIMFLVTSDVEDVYRALLPYIPGSQFGQLAPNSDNVLYWIEKLYNDITSIVELTVRAPDELLLEFTSHCENNTVVTPGSKSCTGLSVGDEVFFTIDVTAESCVEGGSTRFTVSPVGFNEELVVNVELVCDCECQNTGIPNSPECNGNGTLQCGQCACNPGSYGEMCQCSGETTSVGDDRAACMAQNSASVCSGRGECICGECICNKQEDPTRVISGKYCQCDNFNCPLFEGQLCGGPSRGRCECDMATQQSKCVCTSEYTGDSCNCLRSQENCMAPNGLLCNAYGTCNCGACSCKVDSPFKGPTCSDCATCSGQCEVYEACVQCKAFNSGFLTEEQCNMCSVEIVVVTKFPEVEYPYNCSIQHEDNCSIVFIPHFVNGEENVPVIYVLEDTVCPLLPPGPRADPRWIAVGIAVFIVILGIILILAYKAYIMWLDKKEYEEWEREKTNAQFSENENPIYKPASTKHQNPAYGTEILEQDPPLPEKS